MGLKIEGNRIEGYTSYYSNPVESELVEDTSQNDGTYYQETNLYVDNTLLNRAKELWVALYEEKEGGGISEVMYENQGFFIEHLEDRETEKVKIEFSNDGSRTRIFTRSLLNTNTYYLKITINYKDGYSNDTTIIENDLYVNGDVTIAEDKAVKGKLVVDGDLKVNGDLVASKDITIRGNLTLCGRLYDKDGWEYQLPETSKPNFLPIEYSHPGYLSNRSVYLCFDKDIRGTEITVKGTIVHSLIISALNGDNPTLLEIPNSYLYIFEKEEDCDSADWLSKFIGYEKSFIDRDLTFTFNIPAGISDGHIIKSSIWTTNRYRNYPNYYIYYQNSGYYKVNANSINSEYLDSYDLQASYTSHSGHPCIRLFFKEKSVSSGNIVYPSLNAAKTYPNQVETTTKFELVSIKPLK